MMTRGELAVADRYADPQRDIVIERSAFWHEHGLPAATAASLLERMPRYSRFVHRLPAAVEIIDPTSPLALGGRRWQPLIGGGHSPEHLSLFDPVGDVLLGGDQVLPQITPNIAVWPGGDSNPLARYLKSLGTYATLGRDPLLLPAHRQPMRGVECRVEEIRRHHDDRLRRIGDTLDVPKTCFDILPELFGRKLRAEEIGFGLGEGIAHLNLLEANGSLTSKLDADGVRRFAHVKSTNNPSWECCK